MEQSTKKPHFNLYDKLEKCVNQRLLEKLKSLNKNIELLKLKTVKNEAAKN